MSALKRMLFASGPVMRVLMGTSAIALLIAGLKKKHDDRRNEARIHREAPHKLNKP